MIDTGAIRLKVLSLALEGQLSEQRIEDGTADDLYNRIQHCKEQLVLAGKLKRQKPIPRIKDEDVPFALPDSWIWARWGDLAYSIQYGYNAPAKENGCIKMVRISDIQGGKVQWDAVPFCDIDEESIDEYLLHDGDILFARTGGTVGKSFLVSDVSEKSVFAGYLIRSQYSNELSSKFLYLFMNSDLYWKQLQKGTTSMAQPNCNGQSLSKMIVPLPPLAEQQRIVERVESIFSLLDEIDAAQASFMKNQESLRTKLIETVLFANCYGKITTEEFCKHMDLLSGRDLSASEYNDKGEGIPYYTGASNFYNGRLTVNRWTESPAVISKQGDLLVTCKGTVGKMAYATETAHIARQIMAIRPKDIEVEYAYYFMEYYVATLKKKAKGLIPGIERKDLLAAPFPFREEQEQKKIVDKLNELLPLCS